MLNFLKFMIGGFLLLIPAVIAILVIGDILSTSPRARAFAIVAIVLSAMIVGGTELLLSIKPTPKP